MRAVQGMQSVLTHLHASHGSVDEHMASLADGGGHVGKKVPTHTLGGTVSTCRQNSCVPARLALWLETLLCPILHCIVHTVQGQAYRDSVPAATELLP